MEFLTIESLLVSLGLMSVLFMLVFWEKIDVLLCKRLLVPLPRLRLAWCRLYLREDEFHPSLDLEPVLRVCELLQSKKLQFPQKADEILNRQARLGLDHIKRKRLAHERDIVKVA